MNTDSGKVSLRDVLEYLKREIFLELNAHHIGTVKSFDATTQTVQVQLNYLQEFTDGTTRNYPLVIDCPVFMFGGGSAFLSMPVAAGDECLLLFNDRDIDKWYESGQVVAPNSSRLHSFSDAIAFVGLRNATRKIASYDGARAVLANNHARVAVGETLIQIKNDTRNLLALQQSLIDAIKAISVTVPATGLSAPGGGGPVTGTATGAVSGGSQAALDSVKTTFGELLE